MGLPAAPIRAAFSPAHRVPGPRMLTRPEQSARCLAEPGALPCLGKPARSSLGIGGASLIELVDGGAAILLGNGQTVPLDRLIAEIPQALSDGYPFQGLERPTEGTMGDAVASGKPVAFAPLAPGIGVILRVQNMLRMCTQATETAPAAGAPLAWAAVPGLAPAIELAPEVHRLPPAHRVLGTDIALTDAGPVLNEANGKPRHHLYRRASARGLLNPEFKPPIDEALAASEAMPAEAGLGRRRFCRRLGTGRAR